MMPKEVAKNLPRVGMHAPHVVIYGWQPLVCAPLVSVVFLAGVLAFLVHTIVILSRTRSFMHYGTGKKGGMGGVSRRPYLKYDRRRRKMKPRMAVPVDYKYYHVDTSRQPPPGEEKPPVLADEELDQDVLDKCRRELLSFPQRLPQARAEIEKCFPRHDHYRARCRRKNALVPMTDNIFKKLKIHTSDFDPFKPLDEVQPMEKVESLISLLNDTVQVDDRTVKYLQKKKLTGRDSGDESLDKRNPESCLIREDDELHRTLIR